MSFCCVRYNNPAVHFSTQPYLLLFLVFSGNLKLHLFQLFHFFPYTCTTIGNKIALKRLVTPSSLFLDYRRTLPTGHKIRNHRYFKLSFNVASKLEKMKVFLSCQLFLLKKCAWKKNEDFFIIIHI